MKKTTGKVVISSLMVFVFLISALVPMSVALSQDGGVDPTALPTEELQPTPESTDEGENIEPTLPPSDPQMDPTPEPTSEPALPTEVPSPTAPPDAPIVPVAEYEPEDVSHLINISATVSQDLDGDYIWDEVADGGIIDGTAPIQAAFSFAIPVSGDGFADDYAVQQGDYATVLLSNAFSVYDDLYIPQYYGETYVGSVNISSDGVNTYANILFDGDEVIFNSPSVTGVSAWFYADMFYNGHAGSDPWGTELRTLLDNSYYVVVDSDETEYRITDLAAEATLDGNTNRTVLVEAFQSATIAGNLITRYVSLENYTFVYDLEPFGAFIEGSFLLEGLSPEPSAALEDYNLTYSFPAGAVSPATISFNTEGFDGAGLSDMMLPSDMSIMPFAIGDGADVTAVLQGAGFSALVMQDLDNNSTWEPVADGGTIDGTKPVRIDLNFNIPVEGDDPLPAEVVKKWDYALFPISTSFSVHDAANIPLLFDGIPVGTVSFVTDGSGMTFARVDFDGEDIIFEPSGGQAIFGVSAGFTAFLEYDGHEGGDPWGTQDVELLEREFEVKIGTDETTYSLIKTATELTSDRKIRWSVEIDGTQTVTVAGVTHTRHVSLEGYDFVDDLTAVGAYVTDSFQVGGTAPTPTATLTGNVLNYTFPAATTGPVTVTFETEIPDDKYFASGPQPITNKGELYDDTELITSGEVTHPFTPPTWITKTGEAGNEGVGGVYDPTNRTITWTIDFNHAATALNDVQIRDTLAAGLGFVSAEWFTDNSGTWVSSGTWASEPTDGLYDIGDITQKGRLVIVSRVLNTDPTMDITTYYNTASIISTDFPPGTGGPGEIGIAEGGTGVGVPIGFTALTKSGTRLTPNIDRKILWTVSFDPRGQTIDNLKIYDLIVYGNSFSCGSVTGIPTGVTCANLTPRYGQQYVAGTFAPVTGVTAGSVTVLPISQAGTQIADLLEVTLPNSGISSFTFQTQVLDPAIFAANGSANARNTATLIQFNSAGVGTTITSASAAVPFESSILAKRLLHRDEVPKAYTAINPNNTTSNAAEGFNYLEKAAIFQLRVNADGLDWASILNGQGVPLGDVTVTDTLPAGWEFMTFSNGAQYLIYPAGGTTPVSVTGLSASFSGQTATFTFNDLDQAYYILIKARPNDATLTDYLLSSTQPFTRTNNVNLRVPSWDGVNASRNVSVNTRALIKSAIETADGAIQWNILYNPYDLVIGNRLEDKLPDGIDLRIDSTGSLILTGNIIATELAINADGTFTDVGAVTLVQGEPPAGNISYDNSTRTLTFHVPNPNKAYRLSYITDVTGIVQGTVSNSVKLIREDGGEVGDSTSFSVMDRHGQATMGRNGWIQILKRNAQGANLAGATFTLFAADSDTILRQGTSNASGLIRIMGIPVGVYRLIETTPPSGFLPDDTVHIVRVETLEDGSIRTSIDDRTGENTHQITLANYRAEDAVGRLRVVKTVAGTNAETDKLFTFTLTLSETSGEYTYVGTGGAPGGTISGGTATFSLSHGQGITVVGLPAGTTYTVTENSYASDGYQTVSSGATGTIVAEQTQLADFTNTRNLPGELTINKRVEGAVIDPSKTFIFTVTFSTPVTPPVGGYPYIGSGGVADGFISSGGTIALAHGQGITIQALPEGTTYTVVENDYSGDGYVTQSAGATGTIGTQTGSTAAFTNSAPGQMTISKRVEGAGFDPARTFVFTVTFTSPVAAPAGGYPYTGNGVPNGTISSGGTIALAHNQSITITNLPVGTQFVVVENDYSGDGYVTQSTGAQGTISNETSVVFSAAFTNSFPGRLTISKRVEGGTIEANKQFEFTVTFNSPVPQPLAGYPFTGNGVPDGVIRSGETIRLAHNQSITITGLAVGTQYQVSERNYSSDGYVTESSGASGTIDNQTIAGHTAAFTNITSGSLSIRKTVQGNDANRSDRFEFVVSFPDLPSTISFNYTGNGVANGSIMNHSSIWLSHGQSITIQNIPARSRYQVVERGFSGYTSTSVGSTGTIVAGSGVTADFVNTKGKVDYNPNTGDTDTSTRALFAMVYFALLLATLLGLDIYFVQRNRQRSR